MRGCVKRGAACACKCSLCPLPSPVPRLLLRILEQQQQILTELQALVEDKGTFGGHAAFVADGFAEGRAY